MNRNSKETNNNSKS